MPWMVYRGISGVAPLTVNLDTEWSWVIKLTLPAALLPGEKIANHKIGGWVCPKASLDS